MGEMLLRWERQGDGSYRATRHGKAFDIAPHGTKWRCVVQATGPMERLDAMGRLEEVKIAVSEWAATYALRLDETLPHDEVCSASAEELARRLTYDGIFGSVKTWVEALRGRAGTLPQDVTLGIRGFALLAAGATPPGAYGRYRAAAESLVPKEVMTAALQGRVRILRWAP